MFASQTPDSGLTDGNIDTMTMLPPILTSGGGGGTGIVNVPGVPILDITPSPSPSPGNLSSDIPPDNTPLTTDAPGLNLPTGNAGPLQIINTNVPTVSETPSIPNVVRSNNWLVGLILGGVGLYAYSKNKKRKRA